MTLLWVRQSSHTQYQETAKFSILCHRLCTPTEPLRRHLPVADCKTKVAAQIFTGIEVLAAGAQLVSACVTYRHNKIHL